MEVQVGIDILVDGMVNANAALNTIESGMPTSYHSTTELLLLNSAITIDVNASDSNGTIPFSPLNSTLIIFFTIPIIHLYSYN